MRIVEVGGIKLEIDERTARTIEQYRVGEPVKCLVQAYGDKYDLYPGVIIGFADFAELPTIEVMYANTTFNATDPFIIKAINAKTTGIEIAPMQELELLMDRQGMMVKFDAAIRKMETDLSDMMAKREYFDTHFAAVFERAFAPTLVEDEDGEDS